jgi:hypothetical protein
MAQMLLTKKYKVVIISYIIASVERLGKSRKSRTNANTLAIGWAGKERVVRNFRDWSPKAPVGE